MQRLDPDPARDQQCREFLAHFLKGVWINAYLEDFSRVSSELADYRRSHPAPPAAAGEPDPDVAREPAPMPGDGELAVAAAG